MNTGTRVAIVAALTSLIGATLFVGCGENRPADGFDVEDGALRGELAVYMSDDSDGRTNSFYALRATSGVERRLLFDADVSELVPGVQLKVWGTETPEGVRVASFRVVSAPIEERTSALKAGPGFADRAFAFVLVDLGGGVNVTGETVMNRMINDANSIRNYYLYDSYGRQNITAQVFGPIPATLTNCGTTELANALRPMITGNFQHYLWYFGSKQAACAWSGLASVGTAAVPKKDTWYNASTGCVVLVQEPGHNFGMQHSSSIRCAGTPLADDTTTCTASEYGDPFDPMGGGCRHMNAWQKAYQGWFGGCNGVNVTSSGTFTLLPFEMRCDGAQFLKIKAPKTRTVMRSGGGGQATTETLDYYYVELRSPLDFDGTLGGGAALTPRVLLHIANDVRTANQQAIHPYIIDMTPATTSFTDAALAVGQTFTDPAGGLTITATAVSPTQATITVEVAGGTGAPTCLDASTFAAPGPGPEACVANTATPVGTTPIPGTGGGAALGGASGAGGRPGTGGVMGSGGARSGTGGNSGTGGAAAGTGGRNALPGSGGATATGGGGAISTGGAPGADSGIPTGPELDGSTIGGLGIKPGDSVVGGCACAMSMSAVPLPAGGGATVLVAMIMLGLTTRRRSPSRSRSRHQCGQR